MEDDVKAKRAATDQRCEYNVNTNVFVSLSVNM